MQVEHPRAGEAPLPSHVTVDGADYPIVDGVVKCPKSVATTIADAWARRFDVPPDGLLTREDEPPDSDADTDDICGYQDETMDSPCGRDAGWGRDADTGRCKDHHDAEED